MPYKKKPLSPEIVTAFANWIDLGAPYDDSLISKNDNSSWTKKQIAPSTKEFWSFQRLHPPAIPPLVAPFRFNSLDKQPDSKAISRLNRESKLNPQPIDRFILAKLLPKNMSINPPASRKIWIRRAYLDMLGLLPTPMEVKQFEEDTSNNAYEKVVDHLLASPHYGERWGRYWLDLVRFAESHGFEHDYDRPTAFYYRDFVIEALNNDLPYNQFIQWQLSGDEIEPNNRLALMATGYLAAGVHSTQITKNEVEKHRYDELDDILATTGTAMLGLTLGCARCHDHKYDPIPSTDYYRMLSAFTTVVRSEKEIDFDPQEFQKKKKEFDLKHQPYVQQLVEDEKHHLPKRFAEWEKKQGSKHLSNSWIYPKPIRLQSAGKAKLIVQEDNSILVEGTNPNQETLELVYETDLAVITAIELEALTDPHLVRGGPGRAKNGNFALTEFRLERADSNGKNRVGLPLSNAQATFEQKGFSIASTLNKKISTLGWAVDPQFGKNHAARFVLTTPLSNPLNPPHKYQLIVTMKFENNTGHGLGHPRIALTSNPEPSRVPLLEPGIPEAILQTLNQHPEKRTPAQQQLLLRWYQPLDSIWKDLHKKELDHRQLAPKPDVRKVLISSEGVPAVRLHTQGADFLPETHFLKRGDPNQKEGVASNGYLQVLSTFNQADELKVYRVDLQSAPYRETHLKNPKLSFRRTAFAHWITDPHQGGGALLARVIVNRMWQHHFGRGIVDTPSDFGSRGSLPSHPQLLEYLAQRLIENHWQLKPLHREILLSLTYRQDSASNPEELHKDANAELLSRYPIHRLEAEAIRDTILQSAGLLDTKFFGPGTLDENSQRRSIYFTNKRSKLIPMMIIFDAPDGTVSVGDRPTSTIAPQALYLLNHPQIRKCAKAIAQSLCQEIKPDKLDKKSNLVPDKQLDLLRRQRIERLYERLLIRKPTPEEMTKQLQFLDQQQKSYQQDRPVGEAELLALEDLCQITYCLNEFVYIQ